MRKVYIVTEGYYSDYHIIGVFSTLHEAKKFHDLSPEYRTIEPYDLDEFCAPFGRYPFTVWMEQDGSVIDVQSSDHDKGSWEPGIDDDAWHDHHMVLCFRMFAYDKQHAIKIASEQRAMALAQGRLSIDYALKDSFCHFCGKALPDAPKARLVVMKDSTRLEEVASCFDCKEREYGN